ncbi:MAG: glutamate 5-kinase, partial [Candidatus Diapherotrites archaeon]|nr:glutamate 5-kinase [Candidatus Diapherotrites archaeon]
AAKIATASGCAVVIAKGREQGILQKILQGNDVGTVFLPKQALGNKAKWVLFSQPKGSISVDKGAMNALLQRKSLLAKGIVGVKGDFKAKEVVEIACAGKVFARGIVDLDAEKTRKTREGTAIKTENIYIIKK